MMVRYFAYGSNMLPQRLQRRCASARIDVMATLPGFGLSFSKISNDGSGKATIVSSTYAKARVYGIVFHLASDDMPVLDGFEGRGKGYQRLENVIVYAHPERHPLTVTTYIAEHDHMDDSLQPFDWYLDLVVEGARVGGLPKDYCRRLAATPACVDHYPKRDSQQEALAILAETGGFK